MNLKASCVWVLIKIKENSWSLKHALPVNIELYQHNKSSTNRKTRKDVYDENRFFQRRNHNGGCIPYIIFSLVIIIDLRYLFLWKYSFFYNIIFSFSFLPSHSPYIVHINMHFRYAIYVYIARSFFFSIVLPLSIGHNVSYICRRLKFGCILVLFFFFFLT